MTCETCQDLLLAILNNERIPQDDRDAALEHCHSCLECRRARKAYQQNHEELVLTASSHSQYIEAVEHAVLSRLDVQPSEENEPSWMRVINRPFVRVAALIAIIFSLLFLVRPIFWRQADPLPWDTVIARVRQADSVTWNTTVWADGQQFLLKNYLSDGLGFRTEMYVHETLVSLSCYHPDAAELVMMFPVTKDYLILPVDMDAALVMEEHSDIRSIFSTFNTERTTEVGTKTIGGRLVSGLKILPRQPISGGNDATTVTLWADVDTGWPVEMEVEIKSPKAEKVLLRMSDLMWNVPVDEDLFRMSIPDDYRLRIRFDPIVVSTEGAVEGLSTYAELTGFYPDTLNTVGPRQQAAEIIGTKPDNASLIAVYHIYNTVLFMQQLQREQRDVRYYGHRVEPGESEAVLMRWRADEKENRYMVLFGDLTIKELSRSDLLVLERLAGEFP